MADSGIRTCNFWLPNHGEAHIFVLFQVLTSLQENMRVMGNFRKMKKTPTTELNIFLSRKNFRRKRITDLSLLRQKKLVAPESFQCAD